MLPSAHCRSLFSFQGPLKHVDHSHRREVLTGRLTFDENGVENPGLGSMTEEDHRRAMSADDLRSNLAFARNKEQLLRALLAGAQAQAHPSSYVRGQIQSVLPDEIQVELAYITKFQNELNRRGV